MFGIGMPELILILAVALIVIGPKKLPDLAKSLGRALGEFKKATSELKESMEIDNPVSDVKRSFDNLNKDWKKGLYDKATGDSKTEKEPSSEAQASGEQSSEAQAAGEPSSEARFAGEPSLEAQAAGEPSSEAQAAGEPSLEAQVAGEQSSEAQAAGEPSSEAQDAGEPSSEAQLAAESSAVESEGQVDASEDAAGSEDPGTQADEPRDHRSSGGRNEDMPERRVPGPEAGEPDARTAAEVEDADVSSGEKAKKIGEV